MRAEHRFTAAAAGVRNRRSTFKCFSVFIHSIAKQMFYNRVQRFNYRPGSYPDYLCLLQPQISICRGARGVYRSLPGFGASNCHKPCSNTKLKSRSKTKQKKTRSVDIYRFRYK